MTTFERFERAIPELMDDLAPARVPDYVDDMLQATAQVRQRPAWSLPERWLPMGVLAQTTNAPRVPWRSIALVALLVIALVAAGLIVAAGSQPAIPAPFGAAANGALLYRDADGSVRSLDPTSGSVTTIAASSEAFGDPVPSRDGRRIAFMPQGLTPDPIVLTNLDGSSPTTIPGEYRAIDAVDWSPDDRQLVVISDVRGIPSLTVIESDGSGARRLPLGREIFRAWYLPDGRLAFVGADEPGRGCNPLETPTNHCGLFIIDADGTDLTRILSESEYDGLGLHPSPDGTTLLYVLWANGVEGRLHEVDVLTGADRELPLEGIDELFAINRAWYSPDGSSILFDLFEADGDHWAIVPSEGGAVREIGQEWPGDAPDALWSPDGRSVLARYPTATGSELWLLDATGSGADRRLDVVVPYLPEWQRVAPS